MRKKHFVYFQITKMAKKQKASRGGDRATGEERECMNQQLPMHEMNTQVKSMSAVLLQKANHLAKLIQYAKRRGLRTLMTTHDPRHGTGAKNGNDNNNILIYTFSVAHNG